MSKIKFAVVCASNQNRSMEAHHVLRQHNFSISSYGTGTAVRLPGPSADKPNIYSFGTPYDDIYNELASQDRHLYTQNGLLLMLDRNRRIKRAPERFQDTSDVFDVIFTCEERCFDAACESILNRSRQSNQPVHVINVEIIDNHEQATVGGKLILQLAQELVANMSVDGQIEATTDLDQEIGALLEAFIDKTKANILYTITYL
ncbi:hypothetical protein BATDEDRAFT_29671 [Batrachochytrium dendrobatidis JAM81]|uniref:RNA polymerase II subunit A C-terminal domain phosphatase SSU72 n=1 Tax=Batrachochytrium dendrobatidis (strain JAM81 / FGSC 10211) TaxID=684364 RepID=F4NZ84_BATDJ|nr:uncharacterized protein BATDEDRAFT_29671 [Batrachochytrium dendrobatidis JAM81]EGF81846.1 hypothetical protein BATDEDRAFT_29671 [Batrachochytrium dendrobatidis JAM81]|eukprot:XP_006677371.1 hypothetical protein BATDEDRAFT_29671 [Batrachochytrium dendrobatidis JAM81]